LAHCIQRYRTKCAVIFEYMLYVLRRWSNWAVWNSETISVSHFSEDCSRVILHEHFNIVTHHYNDRKFETNRSPSQVIATKGGQSPGMNWRRPLGRPRRTWIQQIGNGTPASWRQMWQSADERGHRGESSQRIMRRDDLMMMMMFAKLSDCASQYQSTVYFLIYLVCPVVYCINRVLK